MQHPINNQEPNVDARDDLMGQTMVATRPKKLLEGISVAQVIAASAAAATSMLLASKIGIAGSVIGAAVSSMVTVICSQLYRNALDASAQKLKRMQGPANYPAAHGNARVVPPSSPTTYPAELHPGARVAPTKLLARAAAERNANARKVALASAGIALLAVAACAGAILLSTAGEGLGTKTEPLFTNTPAEPAATTPEPDQPALPNTTSPSVNDANDSATSPGDDGANQANPMPDGHDQNAEADAPTNNKEEPSEEQAGSATDEGANSTAPNEGANAPATPNQDPSTQNSEAAHPAV